MKSKFKLVSCLLLSFIFIFSVPGIAGERPLIREILITGPTRSDEDIIRRQLPFQEGDYWEEGYTELTRRRIEVLNVFNPLELKIVVEPLAGNYVRVVIRATDTEVLYVDPVELIIMKTVDLLEQQFNQEFRSPFGKGVNYSLGVGWGGNPWWKVGVSYPISNGFSLKWQHKDYDLNASFNGENYHQDGFSDSLYLKQVYTEDWEFGYGLGYRDNEYQLTAEENVKQKYLTGLVEALWKGYGELRVSFLKGRSLEEEQPDYQKVMVDYFKRYRLEKGRLLIRLQGGLAAPETPLNLQFQGGGFSSIPLRGYRYNLAGDRYLGGTLEYHRQLVPAGLWGIIFFDYGKILPVGKDFTEEDWLISGGIGLAYDTPLEIPVRCDLAFNPEGDYNWRLGLGHSF